MKGKNPYTWVVIAIVVAAVAGVVAGRLTASPLVPRSDEVLISEEKENGFDVSPPTVLCVVMKKDDGAEQRCLNMGGWLDGQICRNVDY